LKTPQQSLTQQLLEWIAEKPRTYDELMEAWKTTCPRFTIWEDACDEGLVGRGSGRDSPICLTPKGRDWLREERAAEQN
jgi:hypothetical protein